MTVQTEVTLENIRYTSNLVPHTERSGLDLRNKKKNWGLFFVQTVRKRSDEGHICLHCEHNLKQGFSNVLGPLSKVILTLKCHGNNYYFLLGLLV